MPTHLDPAWKRCDKVRRATLLSIVAIILLAIAMMPIVLHLYDPDIPTSTVIIASLLSLLFLGMLYGVFWLNLCQRCKLYLAFGLFVIFALLLGKTMTDLLFLASTIPIVGFFIAYKLRQNYIAYFQRTFMTSLVQSITPATRYLPTSSMLCAAAIKSGLLGDIHGQIKADDSTMLKSDTGRFEIAVLAYEDATFEHHSIFAHCNCGAHPAQAFAKIVDLFASRFAAKLRSQALENELYFHLPATRDQLCPGLLYSPATDAMLKQYLYLVEHLARLITPQTPSHSVGNAP